jgi:hypothetical protein
MNIKIRNRKTWICLSVIAVIFAAMYVHGKLFEIAKNINPTFVKEWELADIKPGVSAHFIALTADNNGIYALVKGTEHVLKPIQIKRLEEMTEEEKRDFLNTHTFVSGMAMYNATKEEKDHYIDFTIQHLMKAVSAKELDKSEKDQIIQFLTYYKNYEPKENKNGFNRFIQEQGWDQYIDNVLECVNKSRRKELIQYRIQHYNMLGDLIRQWPEDNRLILSEQLKTSTEPIMVSPAEGPDIDSREILINPQRITSDSMGSIYCADYGGNKIVKFNPQGDVENVWRIEDGNMPAYNYFSPQRGLAVNNEKLYLVSEKQTVPSISEYDLNGNLLRSGKIPSMSVPARVPIFGLIIPFLNEEGRVTDIAADEKGDLVYTGL